MAKKTAAEDKYYVILHLGQNKALNFIWIVCKHMIQMKYQALFGFI